jgi:phage terminase Nu1 subunit (DNA packaging protein)
MLVKKADAAKHLGVSVATINNYMKQGMPYHKRKQGRAVRFDPEEITAWFKEVQK